MKRLQDVGGDADGDAFGGFLDRVACEVRVACGGFDPAVTEETADDRQAFAERQCPRGEGVAQIMLRIMVAGWHIQALWRTSCGR